MCVRERGGKWNRGREHDVLVKTWEQVAYLKMWFLQESEQFILIPVLAR